MNKKKYLLLSLKWTGKKDAWLTFWRINSSGYCWFQEWCGQYESIEVKPWIDENQERLIDPETVKDHWIEIEYEGVKRMVLPNTEEVLKILGIAKRHLR